MAVPIAEVAALWACGWSNDRALAVQVTAPAPWGVFHDLRWLLVLHDSWWNLALEAIGMLVLRTGLDGVMARLAGAGRGGVAWFDQLRSRAVFSAFMLLMMFPWAVLGFGVDVVAISWLWFAALPPVAFISLVSGHGGLARRWWSRPPPLAAVAWMAGTFAIETVAGMAMQAAPAGWWVPVAAGAGAANALVWKRLVAICQSAPSSRRWAPVVPAFSLGMLAVAVGGAAISFALIGHRTSAATSGPAPPTELPHHGPAPVLIVSGFDSSLDGSTVNPRLGPLPEVRFSYRGTDPGGRPLPYGAVDTHQPLPRLVRLLAAQVDEVYRRSGQPVNVVAESEGALVARVYAAADPSAPVRMLVLLSPLDQPGRVYYPTGSQDGYGLATGRALELVSTLLKGISPIQLPANSPLLRSIVDHAGAVRNLLACPTPGEEALLEPLADAVADPVGTPAGIKTLVLPAFHGGLLTNATAQSDVTRLLTGRASHPDGVFAAADHAVRLAGAAWQVPTLPLSLYSDSKNDPSCAEMTAAVRQWVGALNG